MIDNPNAPDTDSWPELLARYRISERFELRLGWNFEIAGGANIISANEGAVGYLNLSVFDHAASFRVKGSPVCWSLSISLACSAETSPPLSRNLNRAP